MSETGAVKFAFERGATAPVLCRELAELNAWRRKLLQLRLLGVDATGIGFGNLSVRESGRRFFITGSNTGARAELGPEHIARVTDYDFERNWLRCDGATVASSESLTHAAIYESDASVSAIAHCHSAILWRQWRETAPMTRAEVEYGTPAMAREVIRLFAETKVRQERHFAMGGHVDGIVAFGASLEEACAFLVSALAQPR